MEYIAGSARYSETQVKTYGGDAHIRGHGLLEPAIAQPGASFVGEYLHADIFEMAAAYLFHICMNHPFINRNKPTAGAAALMFLDLNDQQLHMPFTRWCFRWRRVK